MTLAPSARGVEAPGPAGQVSGRPAAAATRRLVVLGLVLESLYLGALVLPYNLFAWLAQPAQDLGSMTHASPASAVGYLASVGGLSLASWLAYREAERWPTAGAARVAFAFAALFAFSLLWIYPIDALDLFDYAMQGRILGVLGGNPYLDFPIAYPADPFLPSVGWKQFPSVYGPLWTYLEGLVGHLSGDNQVASLLAFKAIAALASLACSSCAYRVALLWQPRRAAAAVVLLGWNPLLVLMVGAGHNGILMLALVLGGVWLAATGRRGWGLWLAGLSSLVKLATVPLLPVLAVGQLRRGAGAPVLAGLALAVTTGLLYLPLWPGWEQFGPLLHQQLFTASPLGLAREVLTPGVGQATVDAWVVRAGELLLLGVVGVAVWRARAGERASVRAAHDALFWIVFAVLTWWQPWYVVWIVCLAALDDRPWVAVTSWVASVAGLVSLFDRFYLTQHWLVVDTVSHYVHTLLLVYVPPIACFLLARAGERRGGRR